MNPPNDPPHGWQTDAAAFTALVRRWQQPVARVLARVVGSGDSVQDLCQDVFLKLFLARDRYRENGAFSTWLFQIALNIARDHLRRRQTRAITPSPHVHAFDSTVEPECFRQETADAVARAVAELPTELREVIALRHDQEMNFEQMSRVLGIPASTLKSRFAVAMNRLRRRLAPQMLTANER